ncbi:MAG TPA: TonB-dependent receptor [Verrucomicrobiae bacterium]|nr:TonB-dependent receptor [Verrucomicrobiae bacterium]
MIRSLLITALLVSSAAFAQVTTTARLDGTVTDPQGANVPGAIITVVQTATGQTFHVTADDKGSWALPSVPTGTYKVTVSHPGFKAVTIENVTVDAGVPATVNTKLEVGAATETVQVTAGAAVVQTDTAAVTSTLQGRQINDLPFTSHNVTELIAVQPGTQNADGVRYATIDGLPQPTINITIDGINVQDNATKSNPDSIFNAVQPRTQAIEEMTVSTAAATADSTGEGAVQIKFVTKSGSNTFHGGIYETNRNSYFEACYFFNCLQGTGKDRINLNEYGFTIGGPVLKNKLFFFESFEFFDLPQSFGETGTWLTPTAATGVFTYNPGTGAKTVNLFALAAAANPTLPAGTTPYPTQGDPVLAKTYSLIQQLIGNGTVVSRIATNNDYNRENFTWGPKAVNNRKFQTSRIDYNISEKHHVNFVWNYQTNDRTPDGLNGTLAILPGTGTQLGAPDLEGQYGINWTGSIGLRSVITPTITNEFTGGIQGGANALGDGLSTADYGIWNGKLVSFAGYMTNPYNGNYTNFAPRSTPVYQLNDNVSYLKGSHLLNFGFNFTQLNAWQAAANSSLLNTIALGQATGDPDNTGATSLFTTTTLPGASSTQLSDAANLYAILAGRVSAVTSSAVLGETTHTYGSNFSVDRNHMRELASYVQDTWRVSSKLTLVAGLRWDRQGAPSNLDNLYSRPGYAGVWGVSGVGNLFQPGVLAGAVPVFSLVGNGVQGFDPGVGHFNPSIGLAYRIENGGILHWLTGSDSVLRGGYSVSTIRQGIGALDGVWSGNAGRSLTTSTSPSTTPSVFPAGSVLFASGNFPALAPTSIDPTFPNPTFPLAVQSGQNVSDWNPSIKAEYVQSWSIGFQRQLDRNTVLDVKYVGNHYVDGWAGVNLNEVNVFGNFQGSTFLQQFQAAQNNLAIANGISVGQLQTPGVKLTVNNYGNQGLAGQVNVPIITTAIGSNVDQTTITQLEQGLAGSTANGIATNATRMAALTKAGYPINLFQVNPNNGGGATIETNRNSSTYNSGQVEVRRRLAQGLQIAASYAFSKSLTDANVLTLRDWGGYKGPTTFDIRHGFKVTWIYQLPVGQGREFLQNVHGVGGKILSGWEIAGVGRVQSGSPMNMTSNGRDTFNQNDGGVVLHNMTAKDLQNDLGLNFTSQVSANGVATGTAYYLPQSLIQNTLAAFAISGTLNPNAPYIGPCNTAGQICNQVFLWGPWLSKWDISLVKRTQIKERLNLEFRCQALNVFNHPNILLPSQSATGGNISTGISSSFGQTTTAFRDLNNTNDPGARSLEFVLRLNF